MQIIWDNMTLAERVEACQEANTSIFSARHDDIEYWVEKEFEGKYMSSESVENYFKEVIMPTIRQDYEQDGIPDKPARREAWNNLLDSLQKGGSIHEYQIEDLDCPVTC